MVTTRGGAQSRKTGSTKKKQASTKKATTARSKSRGRSRGRTSAAAASLSSSSSSASSLRRRRVQSDDEDEDDAEDAGYTGGGSRRRAPSRAKAGKSSNKAAGRSRSRSRGRGRGLPSAYKVEEHVPRAVVKDPAVRVLRGRQQSRISVSVNEALHLRKRAQQEDRARLTLLRRPLATTRHFLVVSFEYIVSVLHYCLQHKWTLYGALPLVVLFLAAWSQPGAHTPLVNEALAIGEDIVWWVGLGVLSSIGLGTGMHSGILYLFPFIAKVCLAADECRSLDFNARGEQAFICAEWDTRTVDGQRLVLDTINGGQSPTPVTLMGLFFKVFWPCFLWGAGTALGEIPPYAVSRAARLAGEEDEEFQEILEEKSRYDIVNRMKEWMFTYLQDYGFWAILAFAAWPNMAFDLCGIACGHFLLPFRTFFSATFIGKALIKVNMQALVMIVIFSQQYTAAAQAALTGLLAHLPADMSAKATNALNDFLAAQKRKFHKDHAHEREEPKDVPVLQQAWMWFMVLFLAWFAKSIVESFAQQRQARFDKADNDAWLRQKKRTHHVVD